MSTPLVGRIPVWGSHIYLDLWGLHGELLQEDVWAGGWAGFLRKVSSGEHYGAPKLMLCPRTAVLLPCCCCAMEGVGDSRRGAAVPCLGAAPGLGSAALGLTSLGLNCCFLWEGGKSRAGSPGWGAGGVFVCVFLYDCARNDSLGKDVVLLYLSFNSTV